MRFADHVSSARFDSAPGHQSFSKVLVSDNGDFLLSEPNFYCIWMPAIFQSDAASVQLLDGDKLGWHSRLALSLAAGRGAY